MPNYKAYPSSKDTPNRKSRKGLRSSVFLANRRMRRKVQKREERKAQ